MRVDDNFSTVIASITSLEREIVSAVSEAVTKGIDNMEVDVKASAPRAGDRTPTTNGGGKVVDYNIGSYTYKQYSNRNMDAEFGITGQAEELAAFINFGTGSDAKSFVPTLSTQWQRMAMEFYKNGKGTLIHQPFFTNAWFRVKDQIVKDAQANLDKLKI